ncbi:MAG TPA: hypothetical protein VGN43_10875 [Steroidobacteraceae bacterium]|jgi:hypothetical protein|nr:hypothetical protein [Steroidobacteraceae bacterium]
MTRKIASSALALTGLLIALGGFGHSFMGRRTLDIGLARVALDGHTEKVLYLVWYFCGGCMLVFGLLVMESARRAWRGEYRGLSATALIGIFYLLTGVLSLAYTKEAFWSVFVVLGGLALLLSLILLAPGAARSSQPYQQPR